MENSKSIKDFFERVKQNSPLIEIEKVRLLIAEAEVSSFAKASADKKKGHRNFLKFIIMTTIFAIIVSAVLLWPNSEINNGKSINENRKAIISINDKTTTPHSSLSSEVDKNNNENKPLKERKVNTDHANKFTKQTAVEGITIPFLTTNIAIFNSSKSNWFELVFLESQSYKIGEKDSSIRIVLNSGIPNKPARGIYYFSDKDVEQLLPMSFNGKYYHSKDSILKITGGKLIVDTIGKIHSFHFEFLLANNLMISGEFIPEPKEPANSKKTKQKEELEYAKQILDSTLFIRLNKFELEQLGFVSNDKGFELNYKLDSTNWFVSYYNHMLTFGAKYSGTYPNNNSSDSIQKLVIEAINITFKTRDNSLRTEVPGIAPLVITDDDGKKMLQMSIPKERIMSYFSKKFNKDYRTLLPVVVEKNIFNNQPEQDIVFWFLPTDEFFNCLPQNISEELLTEYNYITAEDKSTLEKPECKYFDECKNTLDVSNFKVFPNPANSNATVTFRLNASVDGKISLVDLAGRERQVLQPQTTLSSGNHRFDLDVSDVPEGIYLITLYSDKGIQTKRFIVTR